METQTSVPVRMTPTLILVVVLVFHMKLLGINGDRYLQLQMRQRVASAGEVPTAQAPGARVAWH